MEILLIIIYLAIIVVVIAGFWKVFSKAGNHDGLQLCLSII